ncbi:filamentous hemagglutinin N-terminal domain-containing protein, partial [Pseudanabaenaceae cyanobacterium LEGE 13415]|nr:filamentous hemagglutinin N-terminal domain-containing protein [Pseudanabaenaceae cyanobacterium LEGE 13415]
MNGSKLKSVLLVSCGISLLLAFPSVAQIIPDATLPNASSVETQGTRSRIFGGTEAGRNLFHSFSEFSIPVGTSVLFDNASSIQNIFTRVTGNNASTIGGLIQANGTANLFLLNPNGILFGTNAQINIGGSFGASTADRFTFGSQGDYSATNPQAPPLLTISAPIGLGIPRPGSPIANQANLTVPGTFTLHADQLQLNGQLSAGQDLVLRSSNPIVSNAQFNTGGNFWIEDFNGGLGSLLSFGGTRIRSLGDVSFGSYQGASLQVLAGGSIRIPNSILINRPGGTNSDSVPLSDRSNFTIDHSPTIDIRAGVKPEALNLTGNAAPTRSEVQIGDILFAEAYRFPRAGNVLITNQFEPNLGLSGGNINLSGGISAFSFYANGLDLAIDSRKDVNVSNSLLSVSVFQNAGDTKILAQGNITLPSIRNTSSFGNGGKIT